MDWFIDRGCGPSFDRPFTVMGRGVEAVRAHMGAAAAAEAAQWAADFDGVPVVYVETAPRRVIGRASL